MTFGRAHLASLILALCAGPVGTAVAAAQEPAASPGRPELVFVTEESPPFMFRARDGRAGGFVAEVLRALSRDTGFDVRFELVPRGTRLQAFRNGVGDLVSVESNSDAARELVPLAPLWSIRELLISKRPRGQGPSSLSDLRNEIVAVHEGSAQHAAVMSLDPAERPRILALSSVQEALATLRTGRSTAVLAQSIAAHRAPAYNDGPPLIETELRQIPYVLATRPGREDLQPVFATAYLRLQQSGELGSIVGRTLMSAPARDEPGGWRLYVLAATGVAAASLLGVFVWSRSLRREVSRRTRELKEAADQQAVQAHILSQVTDAIVITDDHTRVVSWNAGAEELFGRLASEAVGQPVALLITNRLAGARGGDLHEAIATRQTWRGDAEIVRPQGETLFIEATVRPVTDVRGTSSGVLIVARNVDARRRAELDAEIRARQQAVIASLGQRALAGIESQLLLDQAMALARATLQVSAAAVAEIDDSASGVFRAADGWDTGRAGETRLPLDPTTYPGCALSADDATATIDRRRESRTPVDAFHLKEGMTAGAAVVIPGRSGPYGLLLVADRRERRFSRDDIHFLQALANVLGAAHERAVIDTDRVRAEEERRRLEAQMQHVQKLESLGVLAGGIAHDFNNLLVGMLGHAGLALMELAPEDPARDRIEQIQTTAQRAAELTNQMLAYSGKGRFVLQASDLSDIVGEMTHLLRTAVAKNAEIVLDLMPDLPAFDGDPAQIRQVIMNLITNASDAIGTNPGTITVTTGRMRVTRHYVADAWIGTDLPEGEFVFAEVQDTGCGMDAATLGRIFDPFFTTKFTGRGLGLAAVLGIVRGHRGAIKISSAPGRGTTFRVLLPATAARPAQVALPPKQTASTVEGSRVLVVDDEAGVRTIALASLKRAGFQVVTANDGVDAVELLATDRGFHAVLLDMTMPRMDGVEAFRRIKELQPDLPVVLTSGYSAQETTGRFDGDGIAGFIQKPFMPSALVQVMIEAVSRPRRKEVA